MGVPLGLGFLMGAAAGAQQSDASTTRIPEGDVRPDPGWTVRTLAGVTSTLGDLRGRPVFINLWATWCPPCVAELASIDRLAAALDDRVAFLLVSPEDVTPVRAFQRRHRLGVEPVIEETMAPASLGAEALPHTVILDSEGRIVLLHRGAAVWDTPEVEALLRSLIPPGGTRPEFRLLHPDELSTAGWELAVRIPPGWRLYAPGSGDLGLPLAARWSTEVTEPIPARLTGPEPTRVRTPVGPVAVHRGEVTFRVSPPPDGATDLEVSWALCRDDLCVPGRTTVSRSGRSAAGGARRRRSPTKAGERGRSLLRGHGRPGRTTDQL